MLDAFPDFVFGTLTPAALALSAVALIITSFARGWIVSKFTVETMLSGYRLVAEQANLRTTDYIVLWEVEKKRADKLEEIVDTLKIVGEQQLKILQALPVPLSKDDERKVGS